MKRHSSCYEFLLDVDRYRTATLILIGPHYHHQNWLAMTRSVLKDVCNPVMIAITSSVYGCMLQKISASIKGDDEDDCYTTENEGDKVYLRFGTGALANMIKL